jgi:hypothetical protein
MEDDEAHPDAFADLGERDLCGYLIARDHKLAPLELLATVQKHGEVDVELRVAHCRLERGARIDGGEHRRRHDISVTCGACRADFEVERVGLPDRACILTDLLATNRVVMGRKGPGRQLGTGGHEPDSLDPMEVGRVRPER